MRELPRSDVVNKQAKQLLLIIVIKCGLSAGETMITRLSGQKIAKTRREDREDAVKTQ